MRRRSAIGLATIATLVLAWYLATMPLELISPTRFPSPLSMCGSRCPWALGLGVAIEVTAAGKLIDVVRIL